MTKRTLALLLASLWLAFAPASAMGQGTDRPFGFELSWPAAGVYTGTDVDVTVRVRYLSPDQALLTEGSNASLRLELRAPGEAAGASAQARSVAGPVAVSVKSLLEPGRETTATLSIRAPAEGAYSLYAILTLDGQGKTFASDAKGFDVRSALPPGLANLIAGLALFAAVMAIMAAGTEVVIEAVKLTIGLKEKPTALEAFEKLRDELPGQMAKLGVGEGWRKDVGSLTAALDLRLGDLRTELGRFGAVRTAAETFKTGGTNGLADLLMAVYDLATEAAWLSDDLKSKVQEAAKRILSRVATDLTLKIDPSLPVRQQIVNALDRASQSAEGMAKEINDDLASIQRSVAEWASAWLKSEIHTYVESGPEEVKRKLDTHVIPLLGWLGYGPEAAMAAGTELKKQIDDLWGVAQKGANLFTEATQTLLQQLEELRNNLQSPFRKYARWMSDKWEARGYLAVGVTLIPFGLAGVIAGRLAQSTFHTCWLGFPACSAEGIVGFIGGALAALAAWAIFVWIDSKSDARYDATLQSIKDSGLTGLAAILLQRDVAHQDEEVTRIRIMRVISIAVGCLLAYGIQVDALDMLQRSLPGAVIANPDLVRRGETFLFFKLDHALTAGMILTGLAASAGSKFWRDFLGRLEAAKQQAETAAVMIRKARGGREESLA